MKEKYKTYVVTWPPDQELRTRVKIKAAELHLTINELLLLAAKEFVEKH